MIQEIARLSGEIRLVCLAAAAIILLLGGFQVGVAYMTGTDDGKVSAKQKLINLVIGFTIILLLSFALEYIPKA